MSGVSGVRYDGIELKPMLNKAQKRWHQAYTTLYSIRTLLSLGKEILSKKFSRALSYTIIDVEPACSTSINPSSLLQLDSKKNIDHLLQFGGAEGVVAKLESNAENGILGDVEDIAFRRKIFGPNSYRDPPAKTLRVAMGVVIEAFKAPIILILLVCAALSLGFGIKKYGTKGCSDGGSIFAAVFLVIAVSALSNFWQKKELTNLSLASESVQVNVRRNGVQQKITIFDVVVGDVVLLKVGDQVPADGLFLDGHLLKVDESSITGDIVPVEVDSSHNPFLLSGTKVVDGYAQMLVTAVGMNTTWGQIMREITSDSDEKTPLQAKLKELAMFVATVGILAAFVVLDILLIRYFLGDMYSNDGRREFTAGKTNIHHVFNAVVGILATPVAIAAAAIPEGLMVAVKVTLAYSTTRMLANHALVRKLSACEAMGSVTVICTDKKGYLTMKVTKFWLGLKEVDPSSIESANVLELLHQGVGLNEIHHPSGSQSQLSEQAIHEWGVNEMRMDIEELRKSWDILRVEAFNSEEKRSCVLIGKKADNTIHVHQKGAPEIILAMCSCYHDVTGLIKDINNGEREKFQEVIRGMATSGLHCIAFAHKEMSQEDDCEEKCPPKQEEDHFILLGLAGLKHPVREAVTECQNGGVNIKMITGDDMSTAKAVATEWGIIEPNQDAKTGEVVEGVKFRNYTHEERMEKIDKIRVIARAYPLHKLLMVQCLKKKGHVVAVTGNGTGDAVAFRKADVGLSMGIQSTDMAKESSGIVILDDSFVSVVKVLRWGRGIYMNILTFTEFQLTASIASLVIDFVTAISASEPPTINIVAAISAGNVPYATLQLLWVKLIVGILAALALTTEQPDVMNQPPVNRNQPFITGIMWRKMLTQAFYQIAVLLTIQFKGESVFGINSKVKDTMIFNTFVLFQVFMIFNAKKFETNFVEGIQKKKLFWGIIIMIVVFQVVMVELLKRFADTERLDWGQWGVCFGIAAVSWPIGWMVKSIPVSERPFSSYLR